MSELGRRHALERNHYHLTKGSERLRGLLEGTPYALLDARPAGFLGRAAPTDSGNCTCPSASAIGAMITYQRSRLSGPRTKSAILCSGNPPWTDIFPDRSRPNASIRYTHEALAIDAAGRIRSPPVTDVMGMLCGGLGALKYLRSDTEETGRG